ncbi:MAG: hypothetical protein WC604_04895, partial [Candidatus Gracilibacteria bacterium]
MTLGFLEEPFSSARFLSINQRAVLAEFCLATIEGKATLSEKLQEDLAVGERRATALVSSLRRSFSQRANGHPGLQTKVTQCPGNRRKNGYYLQIVPSTHADAAETVAETVAETETSVLEITERIKEIQAALLRQIQHGDKNRDAMPIIDTERRVILAAIEDIRQKVTGALAIPSHGLRKNAKTLVQILLESSERGEAIFVPAIAKKTGGSTEEAILAVSSLDRSLKRSHKINLALKSQRDSRNGRRFGYYIGEKEEQETQENPKKPTLPASTRHLTEDQKQMLATLIDRAVKQTRHQALRKFIVFTALQIADTTAAQITPEYCQYVGYELFKEISPTRNFMDKLINMQKIPEAQFGFKIERTGPNTWQAVLSTDQEALCPILAEMAEQKDEEAKRNPEELRKRVQEGLRHLKVKTKASLQAVLDILVQAYTDKECLSIRKISERSKVKNKIKIERWFRIVHVINRNMPELLGFNVIEEGTERYRLELTECYTPAEMELTGRSAPLPVSVEEGTNFNRDEFDGILNSPKNRKAMRMMPRTRVALEILASHSEKGEAISGHYLKNKTSKTAKPRGKDGENLIKVIRYFLARIADGKMTLNLHKLLTWYLSVDEPAAERPVQIPPAARQQQAAAQPKPATRRPPARQQQAAAQPRPARPARQPAKPAPQSAQAARPRPTPLLPAQRPAKSQPKPARPARQPQAAVQPKPATR